VKPPAPPHLARYGYQWVVVVESLDEWQPRSTGACTTRVGKRNAPRGEPGRNCGAAAVVALKRPTRGGSKWFDVCAEHSFCRWTSGRHVLGWHLVPIEESP
jgi:hypothetical protein